MTCNDPRATETPIARAAAHALHASSDHTIDVDAQATPPTRDWTRRARPRSETPVLVHWIDEKGSVVRLISSSADTGIDMHLL